MQVVYCIISPFLPGNVNRFSADSGVDDRLPDGLTDESDDVQMEENFPPIELSGILVQQYSWVLST